MAKRPDQPSDKKAPQMREDRLKAALKANLARRKAQGRARKAAGGAKDEASEE